MKSGHIRGSFGEERVCGYLSRGGYEILARNYRIKGAEIDIIARKAKTLVFVEVKTRKRGSLSDGTEVLGADKQERIAAAAQRFIENYDTDFDDIRFDAAFLTVSTGESPAVLGLEYIENAFET